MEREKKQTSATKQTETDIAIKTKILEALAGEIEPVKTSIMYKLALLYVTCAMLLLPLIYIGIVLLAGYGIYWHAVENLARFDGESGIAFLLFYGGPLLMGIVIILFMIKPLFAPKEKMEKPQILSRNAQTLLFAFVERLCEIVGSAKPEEIHINCEVNASAGFGSGIFSLFRKDLILTIGTPLVAGLTLRQFAGILAHEFGHFTQQGGLGLTYIVRSINFWFMRVVYERDAWDQALVRYSNELGGWLTLILYITRFFVWLTRRILWVLMMIGNFFSSFMLRQMEYDADKYEIRMGGSDSFEATSRKLPVLQTAAQITQRNLQVHWNEGRLADDFSAFLVANMVEISPDTLKQINRETDSIATGLLDTHPSDKDRIAGACKENSPGIFRLEESAALLFPDFYKVSRAASKGYYGYALNRLIKFENLVPVQNLLHRQEEEEKENTKLRCYFQDTFSEYRSFELTGDPFKPLADSQDTSRKLKEVRTQMVAALPEYNRILTQFIAMEGRIIETTQAQLLLKTDLGIVAEEFNLSQGTLSLARIECEEAREYQAGLYKKLLPFEECAGKRLNLAIELLQVPKIAEKIKDIQKVPVDPEELVKYYQAFARVDGIISDFVALRRIYQGVYVLAINMEGNDENEKFYRTIKEEMEKLRAKILEIRRNLSGIAYPFTHTRGKINISHWAIPRIPTSDDLPGLLEVAEGTIDRLMTLYYRLMGKMTSAAEKAELAIGLVPLPVPPDEKEREKMIKEEGLLKKANNFIEKERIEDALVLIRVETKGKITLPALSAFYYNLLKTNKQNREAATHGLSYLDLLAKGDEKEKSCNLYKECLAFDPKFNPSPETLFKIAGWMTKKGQYKSALNTFIRFTKTNPRHPLVPKAYFFIAKIYHEKLKNSSKARQILTGLIKKYPRHNLIPNARKYLNILTRRGAGTK